MSDIHLLQAEPTDAERAAVDAFLGPPASRWEGGHRHDAGPDGRIVHGGHELRSRRHLLLPTLHALDDAVGWISDGGLNYVCQRLSVPPADAYGVATFYAMFSVTPRPPQVVHLCDDVVCREQGAEAVAARLADTLGPEGEGGEDAVATWHRSPCLGVCNRAPAAFLQRANGGIDDTLAPADGESLAAAVRAGSVAEPVEPPDPATEVPQVSQSAGNGDAPAFPLRLLRRVGRIDPERFDAYHAAGGSTALRNALALGPSGVLREIADSQLVGRGGAAFPTAVKWEAVATAPERPHYVICNADESEPGTFKDRVLMESDPFALIEAMTIAGITVGAEEGYLYLRGEYPVALHRLQHAIDEARARGLLGDAVMGSGFAFDLEIRRGAGAYICGEETALMESIEGKRGEPRNKPPFPTQVGLFGKPTVINNVETLLNVLEILREGGSAFARHGSERSSGTRVFAVSGSVQRPGVYEAPFGVTVRQLLDLAGGVPSGRTLRTVLLGGAAGSFIGLDQLDVPLTMEDARQAGITMGSGAVVAMDDAVDLAGALARMAAFFRDESCGQCVPCRVGTVRQEEALQRLLHDAPHGSPADEDALLADLTQVMRDASICGLGQTAPNALQSALALGLLSQGSSSQGAR